jgi:hypothetical protein
MTIIFNKSLLLNLRHKKSIQNKNRYHLYFLSAENTMPSYKTQGISCDMQQLSPYLRTRNFTNLSWSTKRITNMLVMNSLIKSLYSLRRSYKLLTSFIYLLHPTLERYKLATGGFRNVCLSNKPKLTISTRPFLIIECIVI